MQGDEVLMSYGDQSNDSLLQFYGFVEADCSCDCYTLTGFVPKARKAAEAAGLATRYAQALTSSCHVSCRYLCQSAEALATFLHSHLA